jgi:poly-beta-1,6-N-acetyl-D-glucosamine synthase
MVKPRYVIVTPAHNEECFIERTLQSIVQQTVPPVRWVIVDDGSIDGTAAIVERYLKQYQYIRFTKVHRPEGRHFGNKVRAFNVGLKIAQRSGYDFLGNLDADISLDPDYYERILGEFERNPRLGLAGGMVWTSIKGKFVSQNVSSDSVAGAIQLFRRECFEQTGGYTALPNGGIDAAIEIVARMHGWNVRTFAELRAREHRRTGAAVASPLAARLKEGKRLYAIGYGFPFFALRCIYRCTERPRIIGSVAALGSYILACLKRDPLVLKPDAVAYLRREQRAKMLRPLARLTTFR